MSNDLTPEENASEIEREITSLLAVRTHDRLCVEALALIQRLQMQRTELKRDASVNAPWLSTAHMLCADNGIAPGHINDRLKALGDKIEAQRAHEPRAAISDKDRAMIVGTLARLECKCTNFGDGDFAQCGRCSSLQILNGPSGRIASETGDRKPMRMRIDRDRLREQIKNDPDSDIEAGRADVDLLHEVAKQSSETSTTPCSVKDCNESAVFSGVCAIHAMQLKHVTNDRPSPDNPVPPGERMCKQCDGSPLVEHSEDCPLHPSFKTPRSES